MNEKEYEYRFGEWIKYVKKENVKLDETGNINYREPRKAEMFDKYYAEWQTLIKEYRLRMKHLQIQEALQALKNNGIKHELKSWTNGHILAEAKNGTKLSYYATTGTIAGYYGTEMNGIDKFVDLCQRM